MSNNDGTGASLFYYDVDSFDEMQIESNSHGADVQTAGVVLNMVPKSGSNAFHGSGSVFYGGENVQADNVDDELRARGVDVLDVEYAATVRLLLGSTEPAGVAAHVAALTGGTGTVERVGERWV